MIEKIIPLYSQKICSLFQIWNFAYVVFMMLSIVIFALETVDTLRGPGRTWSNSSTLTPQELLLFSQPLAVLHYLDITCNVFFTLEPLVRLATCPNRRIFLLSPLNIVDLFLIITMWVGLALEDFIVPGIRLVRKKNILFGPYCNKTNVSQVHFISVRLNKVWVSLQ